MHEGVSKNLEILKPKAKIATPNDWQEFKSLTLEAYTSKDSWKFGITEENKEEKIKEEEAMSSDEWKKELSGLNFGVLCWADSEAVGMGLVEKQGVSLGYWFLHSIYIKEKYRGKHLGHELYATMLRQIVRRDGGKVVLFVKALNKESIALAGKFGFEKPKDYLSQEGFFMELKEVNNRDLISKIDEILNEG